MPCGLYRCVHLTPPPHTHTDQLDPFSRGPFFLELGVKGVPIVAPCAGSSVVRKLKISLAARLNGLRSNLKVQKEEFASFP